MAVHDTARTGIMAGHGRARHGRAGQGMAEQGRTGQDRAWHGMKAWWGCPALPCLALPCIALPCTGPRCSALPARCVCCQEVLPRHIMLIRLSDRNVCRGTRTAQHDCMYWRRHTRAHTHTHIHSSTPRTHTHSVLRTQKSMFSILHGARQGQAGKQADERADERAD